MGLRFRHSRATDELGIRGFSWIWNSIDFARATAHSPPFDRDWQNGNDHDGDHDGFEIPFNNWNFPKEKSSANQKNHPQERAGHVVELECTKSHDANSCEKRSEGANDWNESCQDHSFRSMSLEELSCSLKMRNSQERDLAATCASSTVVTIFPEGTVIPTFESN